MAEEIHELIVSVDSRGVGRTTEELEKQSDAFEDMGGTAEEQTGRLSKFSKRWKGAMNVFVGGLAVAAAGLASQVPIFEEVFSGIRAIITSVALVMDDKLRPVLSPITRGMFDIANAISETEGPMRDLVAVAGTIVTILGGVVTAAFAVGTAIGGLSGGVSAVASIFSALAAPIGVIIAILGGPLTLAIVGIIAIVATLALAWQNNWFGIRDKTKAVIDTILGWLDDLISGVEDAISALNRLAQKRRGGGGRGPDQDPSTPEHDVFAGTPTVSERRRAAQFESIPGLPVLQSGGLIKQTGAAVVHRGERVVPPADVDRGRRDDRHALSSITTEINLDGRKIGEATKKFNARGLLNSGRVPRRR